MTVDQTSAVSSFAIVVGSHHVNSQSLKVGRYVCSRVQLLGLAESVFVLEMGTMRLPLWESDIAQRLPEAGALWLTTSEQLRDSDAVVFVIPEWHGMVPAAVKNLMLYCDQHQLAHKPGLLVGVSAGNNGAYPVAEMRLSSAKNTRLCFVPDHVIVQQVEAVLNGKDVAGEVDHSLRERIDYSLKVLHAYAQALAEVRRSGVIDLETFPYGQ